MPQAYTNDHSSSVLQTHSWRDATNSAAYLLPHLKPSMSILDVGCGPGSITIDLAKKVPTGHVVGMEYVSDTLEGAQSLATSEGVSNVRFQIGDIHDLPFPENTFDIVHAHQVLQHITDPVQALKEMRRVVKQGGIVAIRESTSITVYPETEGLAAWSNLGERMRRAKGNHTKAGSCLHAWAKQAEFPRDSIQTSTGSWCFSSPDERKYWGGSMEGRALSSGFSSTAIQEGFASHEDLEKMASAWRAFVENEDGWIGLLHGQILCWK